MLRNKYRNEQIQLAEKISQYEEKLTATKTTEENVRKWVDLISKYSEINELTAPLLNELIEKIVVHEKNLMPTENRREILKSITVLSAELINTH